MFDKWKKPKYLPAEEAITRGDLSKMDITYSIASEGDLSRMKIRTGYNQNEEMYYIQITERETLLSYRIYLTAPQFKDLVVHMNKTYQFETIDKEKKEMK